MIVRAVVLVVVAGFCIAASLAASRWFQGGHLPNRIDTFDLQLPEPGPTLVQFTSPYCHDCKQMLPLLENVSRQASAHLAVIDAKQRPDLVGKYKIRSTPTVFVVDAAGKVAGAWKSTPPEHELTAALAGARV